ncbi:MAG: hypothetical protein QXG00_07080 [Candidatus Woesearchaeota archaeon]
METLLVKLTALNVYDIINILTLLVTVASIFCAGTTTPNPNTKLGKIYKIIEFLAFNFGKAKDTGNKA